MKRTMFKRCAGALLFGLAMAAAGVQAQTQPQDPAAGGDPALGNAAAGVPAQILVTGRRPGPGLWKVSKDGHVMWVFGLYGPLPKDMEWDAGRVERVLAGAQELVLSPRAISHLHVVQKLRLLAAMPSLLSIKENPDGARLQDVVPPDAYAHWTALKAKYIGQDDHVETLRPVFAAQELLRAARARNGLSTEDKVRDQIVQIARKNKLRLTLPEFEVPVADPNKKIQEFKQARLNDVGCFAHLLDSLEDDIDTMRARANAWANGNIAEIGRLDFARREACVAPILNSSFASDIEGLKGFAEHLHEAWAAAAEKALAANASTFAILYMEDIVGPQSYLADLQARGYTVESPK